MSKLVSCTVREGDWAGKYKQDSDIQSAVGMMPHCSGVNLMIW